MSNHFHLVVLYDPTAAQKWEDEEVVRRWLRVCPPKNADGSITLDRLRVVGSELLADQNQLNAIRNKLGSLSTFMKLLKQPIARRANTEDECFGHFFEQRYYSAALLDEDAILAAMAYVDLNPIRAQIAKTISDIKHTSIQSRLKTRESNNPLAPVIAGLNKRQYIQASLGNYIHRLESLTANHDPPRAARWRQQVALIKSRQRAFGGLAELQKWIAQRGWQLRECPLP